MQINKYIYSINYDNNERALSKLESRYIFNKEEKDKLIFSNIKVEPSDSAFFKNRLEIITFSRNYDRLIINIKKESFYIEGFKVEYLVFKDDTITYADRLEKLREIGYSIEGTHDYYKPKKTFALCYYQDVWYFGVLIKNNLDWHKHKQKPFSFSNSIGVNVAKSLINIATNGSKEKKLLDACCGVGTILLEACFSGYDIEGCDINHKICKAARENISHFKYSVNIYHSDIKDINQRYEAAIIDLPYNLFTSATDSDILHIIESTAEITDRLVIVSTSDITNIISKVGFRIFDYCSVSKRGKRNFARKIWVCEKNKSM
jgi:tRNA G10  N-methylase Trm11